MCMHKIGAKFVRVNQALGCVDDHRNHCRLGTMRRSYTKLLRRPSEESQVAKWIVQMTKLGRSREIM